MKSGKNTKLSVGLIGAGYIAQFHLQVLKKIKRVHVKAICDQSIERAKSLKQQFNIPKAYGSIDLFLEENKFDIVHVLVPPNFHFSIAKQVLESGAGLFLEKPMAETAEECRILNEIAQKNNAVIGINQNSLTHPLFLKLKKDLEKKIIGNVHQVVGFQSGPLGQLDFEVFSHWMFQKPENILLEQGPHPVAQVMDLLGGLKKISATIEGERTLGYNQRFFDRWQAVAECEKGSAYIHFSWGKDYYLQNSLEVSGQDGKIRLDLLKNIYQVQKKSVFPDYMSPLVSSASFIKLAASSGGEFLRYLASKLGIIEQGDGFYLAMKNSIEKFYSSIQDTGVPYVSGEEGERIMSFCEKWVEAAGPKKNDKISETPNSKKPDTPKVLITGAGGFIGKDLVRRFIDQNIAVRAFVRSTKGLSELFYHPLVEVFQGNLHDRESLKNAVSGVDYVYHLAHALGQTWDDFKTINVESTKNLTEAALSEGVKKFIFTSTIATYYTGNLKNPHVDETMGIDPLPEKRNYYARSKMVLENLLLELHKEEKLPVVIFRPAIVVGKGGNPYHPGIGQWGNDYTCAYWGWGRNDLPYVLVEDVSSALFNVTTTKEKVDGEMFNLAGDVRFSAREYVDYLRKHSMRKIVDFPYPMPLCFMSEVIKYSIKFIGRSHHGTLLSYRDLKNRSILADFDNSKTKRLLAWEPCSDKKQFIEKAIVEPLLGKKS